MKLLNYPKIILVLQWDEIKSEKDQIKSTISPIIAEMRDGEILDKDDIISPSSNLYIRRQSYDCHGCLDIKETKMTSDCAILGPISNHDKNFWYNWYTEAIIAAGFHNYICFICDLTKLSHCKNEIKVYLQNTWPDSYIFINNFKCTIIPVINEKLSHYVPEFMRQSIIIKENNVNIEHLFKILTLKKCGHNLSISVDKEVCNYNFK